MVTNRHGKKLLLNVSEINLKQEQMPQDSFLYNFFTLFLKNDFLFILSIYFIILNA